MTIPFSSVIIDMSKYACENAPAEGTNMKRFLVPDALFSTYRDLTPGMLRDRGITALILDIDNTLLPYEIPTPDGDLTEWVRGMQEGGVSLCLVSNNKLPRIRLVSEPLGLFAVPKAGKPFARGFRRAMREMGSTAATTASLGDQIFTDVLASRFAGLAMSLTVPPIKDKTDPFTRFKRALERPVWRRFKKKGNAYDL